MKINGKTTTIAHEIDLYNINPEFDFTFDTNLYAALDDKELERMDDLDGYHWPFMA